VPSKKPKYEVGYGCPPRETRFKKGQSGNPKGRPKGSLNFTTALMRVLSERVTIRENGKTVSIPKLELVARRLVHGSAGGDLGMIRALLPQLDRLSFEDTQTSALDQLSDQDPHLLARLVQRIRRAAQDSSDDPLNEASAPEEPDEPADADD
jgi:hypothetical protein